MKSNRAFSNDGGQLAVIVFFGLTIAFIAFFWILIGGGMLDATTQIHNNLTQGSNPIALSADRQNAMSFLQNAWDAVPVIAFILTILMVILYGVANRNQQV